MQIGYTQSHWPGGNDQLLDRVANRILAQGFRVCGTTQINSDTPGGGACTMRVRVLPAGPLIGISQQRGPLARGCRLDPAGLEQAVALVSQSLSPETDLLIINKFGKHEASGRGFRTVIAQAFALSVPVLVGVNTLNTDDFDAFASGLAQQLPATQEALLAWVSRTAALRRHTHKSEPATPAGPYRSRPDQTQTQPLERRPAR